MTLSPLLRRLVVAFVTIALTLGVAQLGSAPAAEARRSCPAGKVAKTITVKKHVKVKVKRKHRRHHHKAQYKTKIKKVRVQVCVRLPVKPVPVKPPVTPPVTTPVTPPVTTPPATTPTGSDAPASLGPGGMIGFTGNQTMAWINSHPSDPRTATFRQVIASQPTSLWLTGDESFWNLSSYVKTTREKDGTMVLTVWNIPLRWDGLSTPSTVAADAYKTWMTKVAQTIGTTRAILVLEPDALWFYDRLSSAAAKQQRLQALQSAITALDTYAPNTRVYLEAGTTSGSVTPERMGDILDLAGVRQIAGFAVNVSSFSPTDKIEAYAGRIRAELQRRGVADPRFVVDTSRNGAPTWDFTWCNPDGRRIGANPGLVGAASGYDYRLWIKGPGTSDGSCGNGPGSNGGDFLPAVAYKMITG